MFTRRVVLVRLMLLYQVEAKFDHWRATRKPWHPSSTESGKSLRDTTSNVQRGGADFRLVPSSGLRLVQAPPLEPPQRTSRDQRESSTCSPERFRRKFDCPEGGQAEVRVEVDAHAITERGGGGGRLRVHVPECEFGDSKSTIKQPEGFHTPTRDSWGVVEFLRVPDEVRGEKFTMVINCHCRPHEALADLLKDRIGDSKSEVGSIVSQLAETTKRLRRQYLEEVGSTQYLVPERMVPGPRGLPAALGVEASRTKFLQTDVVFKYLQLSIGKQPHLESGSIGRQTFLDNSYGTTELGVPQRLLFQDNTAYPLVRKYVDCFYLTQSAQRLREVVFFVQQCLSIFSKRSLSTLYLRLRVARLV